MDIFKRAQYNKVGIGGIKCYCCNGIARKGRGKADRSLNGFARAKVKKETLNEINEYFNNN